MTKTLPASMNPLAGHSVMQMLGVAMSSIIGDYDDAGLVPGWQWVKQRASHEHVGVKDDSAYEYTLNLTMELDATQPELSPLITAVEQMDWLDYTGPFPDSWTNHSSNEEIALFRHLCAISPANIH
ncbi:hypothetical protein [Aeromonas hydrophila]|uniref:hypothetical protein n=1 Tax=Aeromonas hydrophila TaxID=644 RepID=UPI001F47C08C|nr:hypothetical protein [Aeromonas hydrophila]